MAYPGPVNPDQYNYQTQVVFGGYDHRRSTGQYSHRLANQSYRMDFYDTENMTADYYPVLASRRPFGFPASRPGRYNGAIGGDFLYVAIGTKLYRYNEDSENPQHYDEVTGVTLTDTPKRMTRLGNKIIIFPDKICVTETYAGGRVISWTVSPLDTSLSWTDGPIFFSGTYEGEPATANCIYSATNWVDRFRIGDAVEISGCSIHPENNMTVVIRDIKTGTYTDSQLQTKQYAILYFYDNTFTFGDAETTTISTEDGEVTVPGYCEHGTQEQHVKIARNVPDLDIVFTHENRVWGAGKDPDTARDMIWASALGNPEVWYNFDPTGLEAWTVEVLDDGDFTGGYSFLGYPIFFKDNHIYKIYGSIPSEFRVVQSADIGVAPGSDKSLAIAGEKLYYMSRVGIMVYSGALPQIISAPLADIEYKNAIAGSDGVKYWVSLERIDGEREIFVYDTQSGLWHKEVYSLKRRLFIGFVYHNHGIYAVYEAPPDDDHVDYFTNLCYIGQDMYAPQDVPGFDPEVTEWYVETHDITEASPLRKWIGAELDIRAELGTGDDDTADFSVYISYDFKRTWQKIGGPYSGHGKRSYIVPQIPRRADYFSLRIEGHGRVWIHSIAPKTEQGSSWHGINGGD